MQGVHDPCYCFIVARFLVLNGASWLRRVRCTYYYRSILNNTNEGGHSQPQILNDHRLGLRLCSLSDPRLERLRPRGRLRLLSRSREREL
jgi:hypothetical protein